MITVEKLSWSFPQKDLYSDISFEIEDGRHCVLVGSNGTGKTTLINLLADTDSYVIHHGGIRKPANCKVGLVSQYIKRTKQQTSTVFEFLSEDFLRMQAEMEAICAEMETAENVDEVSERYQKSMDAFDAVDGYNYEQNIRQSLETAGLTRIRDVALENISGGEYKLVQIIREMLKYPDFLIMDEPDAFLDFQNICGLCELINGHKGTMLVVTHNRYLLNHCFDKVLHLENQGIREYDGSYPEYSCALLQMKSDLQEISTKELDWLEIQRALVDRLRDDATKVIDPYRGKKLHARVSYLARLEARHTQEPFLEAREIRIHLPEVSIDSQKPVLHVENYSLVYDEPLLQNVSFDVMPGEKCILVGANGTGKSTLLREIYSGAATAASVQPGIRTAFLSQVYGETLPEDETIYEVFQNLGMQDRGEIEAYLSNYGFDPETLVSKTGVLSGGEKNLLQLAMISLGDAELLFLDEPTSHLDLKAQLALEQALKDYHGSVLMVSHDFYTIVDCADTILYVENGTIRRMSGRAFRKMVYKKHFSSDYLLLEQQKKELELKIESLLEVHDYKQAKGLCNQLEEVLSQMQ